MKCPKCGYLGFEPVDRCRNCGYDFSLARPIVLSELPIRTETPVAPLEDLTLIDAWTSRQPRQLEADAFEFDVDLGRVLDRAHDVTSPRSALPVSPTGELPLFAPSTGDEGAAVKPARPRIPAEAQQAGDPTGPLSPARVAQRERGADAGLAAPARGLQRERGADAGPASPARGLQRERGASGVVEPLPPLAVRREIPGAVRLEHREADLLERDRARFSSRRGGERAQVEAESEPATSDSVSSSPSPRDAGLGARFIAVAIDVLLLAIVDAVVVYFTLAICGLSLTEIGLLPIGPLLAFLLGQNLGYLIVFNAGGQTIGKMTTGIKVVSEDTGSSLSLGHALLRTFVWFVLAVPAGLGFLTALVSRDHRGLHDRFAGTRVVRASA
jgi:uncharacterized RDD family membrane protein YckC